MVDVKIGRKICLLGDPAVGKTSLIKRFVYDRFDDKYISTMGTKVSRKEVRIGDKKIVLLIWDILGQKETKMHKVYYKGTKGAILVADITRGETIEHIRTWYRDLCNAVGAVPVVIAVNKIDLKDKWYRSPEDLKKDLVIYGRCIFTSAKTGECVEDAFMHLAKAIVIGGD